MKNKKMVQIVWWIYLFLLFVVVIVKFNGSFEELKNRIIMFSSEESRNYNKLREVCKVKVLVMNCSKYEWADIIISVAPSYWADIPGQFKVFMGI